MFLILILVGCKTNYEEIETPNVASTIQATSTTNASNDNNIEETSVRFNEYNINLDINPFTREFTAIQKINYTNHSNVPIETIYFNIPLNAFSENSPIVPYFENEISLVFRNDIIDYGYLDIEKININQEETYFKKTFTTLEIYFPEPLLQNKTSEISLELKGYIPNIKNLIGANDKAIWASNLFPTVAVYDDLGWHKTSYYPVGNPFFSDISIYNVSITTPIGFSVNGPGTKQINDYEDKITTNFITKPIRNFSFSITDEKSLKISTNDDTFTKDFDVYFYTYSTIDDSKQERINYLINLAYKTINYFNNTVGIYPYDHISIMETELYSSDKYTGSQILFLDTNILFGPDSNIEEILIKSIANQWFYNIIGNNQISESWISESFINLLKEYILNSNEEVDNLMLKDYEHLNGRIKYKENYSLLQDLSVYNNHEDYKDIQITKSKLMLYSLKNKMGDKAFFEFIKSYSNLYSFNIVNKTKLINTAEEIYGASLKSFFDSWMLDYELPPL